MPVTFLIANNAQYQILKIGALGLKLPQATAGRFEGLDIVNPEIDLVSLAKSLGIEAMRVRKAGELSDVLGQSLNSDKPLLIDVPITREGPGRLNYG